MWVHHSTSTPKIQAIFQKYYKGFSSKVSFDSDVLTHFLDSIKNTRITEANNTVLTLPILLEELTMALKDTHDNKALGAKVVPAEVYKQYGGVLLELLQDLNEASQLGNLPQTMNEAIIIAIPKLDNDPFYTELYHLISLPTMDICKVLANKLSMIIGRIVQRTNQALSRLGPLSQTLEDNIPIYKFPLKYG